MWGRKIWELAVAAKCPAASTAFDRYNQSDRQPVSMGDNKNLAVGRRMAVQRVRFDVGFCCIRRISTERNGCCAEIIQKDAAANAIGPCDTHNPGVASWTHVLFKF